MTLEVQPLSANAPIESAQKLPWVKPLVWGVAVTVLLVTLSLYLQPSFLMTLATQVWACF